MRIGSLFAGIGGLELGLEWAGVGHTVWQVERDPYCQRVLAKHWPDAQRFDDVCTVGAHNLPPVDVLCGGFPCQDISYAGKGAGLAGARSGLWFEYARIIRETRPSYVVVENSAALLTRGLDTVLGTLADLGYDAEWHRLSAADVGAPHLRRRIFIIAYTADANGQGEYDGAVDAEVASSPQSLSDADRDELWQQPGRREPGWPGASLVGVDGAQGVAARPHAKRDGLERLEQAWAATRAAYGPRNGRNTGWWEVEPNVGRVADGVPARMDRLRALGNAVVPQCAEAIGRRLLSIAQERAA